MILKEFELNLPYASDKEKVIEMIKANGMTLLGKNKDESIEWKWIRREFALQTRCVTAMFERLFNKYKIAGGRKILIECVDVIRNDNIINYSGVYVVQLKFNFLNFILLSDYEKKVNSFQILKEGVEKVATYKGWDSAPFSSVFNEMTENNYLNEWTWSKPVKSPNKESVAQVICHHEVNKMNIFMEVMGSKGQSLGRSLLLTDQPHEFAYAKHLGKVTWEDNEIVSLINKQEDEKWSLNIRKL
ncbi:hypothetical protein SAMN02799630_04557 [Paenibacillus sp. UNCCL117]|uniref:hypothetical protein n=1 Tax=unclassified Paenibacillus TaxID=185978 RepID=UPI00088DE533|nr:MULTISPECIES: hypothetical protein [unclassified Paenibacillus]SDD64428.1 hypothetical protein SAMN04488602_11183 [Paenibacillus sp. cl123]SFW58322.1 hypothetical protein SAMN02799630_04557 [Paenibacillus sp. UNCCL117]